MARSIVERLTWELKQIREELRKELASVTDLDWAPAEGMKSYRALLKEIGAMQAETSIFVREGRLPKWEEAESHVTGETSDEILTSLDQELEGLVTFLAAGDLSGTLPISEFADYFGTDQIEPEEMIRWIARHEYYHLGQIVTYNWIRGHNPYK